jgi:hypothetical protein
MVKGRSDQSIDPDCLPALTVDGGLVTGVLADPPLDAIRACVNTVYSVGDPESGSGTAPPEVVTEASVPESTVP